MHYTPPADIDRPMNETVRKERRTGRKECKTSYPISWWDSFPRWYTWFSIPFKLQLRWNVVWKQVLVWYYEIEMCIVYQLFWGCPGGRVKVSLIRGGPGGHRKTVIWKQISEIMWFETRCLFCYKRYSERDKENTWTYRCRCHERLKGITTDLNVSHTQDVCYEEIERDLNRILVYDYT